jgi:hypothetical protein
MKPLLIEEMKRALQLLESKEITEAESEDVNYWDICKPRAELKQLLLQIRRHSVMYEKEELK